MDVSALHVDVDGGRRGRPGRREAASVYTHASCLVSSTAHSITVIRFGDNTKKPRTKLVDGTAGLLKYATDGTVMQVKLEWGRRGRPGRREEGRGGYAQAEQFGPRLE
jgi:hypothetical protein